MSKNVVIQQDGTSQTINGVTKVQTPLIGGSNMSWLPEDETIPTTLKVTENGEYEPPEGFYGFYKVDVMVPGGGGGEIETDNEDGTIDTEYVIPPPSDVTGSSFVVRDPDTGVWTYYLLDDDGVIQKTKVPNCAVVSKLPKTAYAATEQMDYTGAEITLYYGDNTVAEDWEGGVLVEGTQAWDDYVVTTDGTAQEVVQNGIVIMYVKPWWYRGGMFFDKGYWVRAFYTATVS